MAVMFPVGGKRYKASAESEGTSLGRGQVHPLVPSQWFKQTPLFGTRLPPQANLTLSISRPNPLELA